MRVLGVSGGNGVILYPFRKHLVANIEKRSKFKTPNDIQWELNFGSVPLLRNLETFSDIDVIIGAPDCGHSSIMSYSRIKTLSNPRDNESLSTFFLAVKSIKPKSFLLENLPKLLAEIGKGEIKRNFDEYDITFIEGPVSFYGNSQTTRVRLLIIGIRKDLNIPTDFKENLYEKQDGELTKPKLQTTGDLLLGLGEEDIPELCHIREDIEQDITIYGGKKLKLRDIRDGWLMKDCERWGVGEGKFHCAPGVYRNRAEKYPKTVRPANRQFNPEGLMMSPRELARIQGVPDKFRLYYDDTRRQFCINKGRITIAKSPPYEVGAWFKEQLKHIGLWEKNRKRKK